MAEKPTLVVGATGQVGRRVVEQLLNANKPVRALVRNHSKARELFGKYMMEDDEKTKLKIFVCDLGEAAKQEDYKVLNQAVEGCGSIVSVSGCARISKLSDFLPWRLFREDVSGWADSSHPYFGNYKAQCVLVDLAKTHSVSRFVRLTGLSAGYSPFHPVGIIFSSVLSMTTRYHFLCEQYIRNSSVPYLIIRPGGLRNEDRDSTTTHLQVDASGSLPPPGMVSRSDVAAVATMCSGRQLLSADHSFTLAVRAVGDNVKPRPQGAKEDGYATVEECLKAVEFQSDSIDKTQHSKPYGLAVGVLVYSLSAIGLKVGTLMVGGLYKLTK